METMKSTCSVVVVTHNSEKHIHKALNCLLRQKPVVRVVVVDSGSSNPKYLDVYKKNPRITVVVTGQDVGFCRGNNIGMQHIDPSSVYVAFVNPDAFVSDDFFSHAIGFLDEPRNHDAGAMTPLLLGYDIDRDAPTGLYDSTGVFHTWYGRWYDRDGGVPCADKSYGAVEELPAICGALMVCRKAAIDQVLLRDGEVFDNTFYMYKEDVDLSQRLRDRGWRLLLLPQQQVFHCRGWNVDRRKMPRKFRIASARNTIRVNRRLGFWATGYAVLQYLAVKLLGL